MKKFITYGVAAALTMSSFALPTTVPVYATGGGEYACGSSENIADGDVVTIGKTATECELHFAFANEIVAPTNMLTFTGLNNGPNSDLSYTVSDTDATNVTVSIQSAGVEKVRVAGDAGVTLTVSDRNRETFTVTLKAEPWGQNFTYSLDGEEATEVGTEPIEITDDTESLVFEATFANEIVTPGNMLTFSGLSYSDPSSRQLDYELDSFKHVATITVNEKGINAIKEAGEAGITLKIETSTSGEQFEAVIKYSPEVPVTEVTAGFVDNKNKVAPGESTTVTATTDCDDACTDVYIISYAARGENADLVTVDGNTVTATDAPYATEREVEIVAIAEIEGKDEPVESEPITLTIAPNVESITATAEDTEIEATKTANVNVVVNTYEGDDFTYTYTSSDEAVAVVEDGVVRVVPGYVADENATITVTVSTTIDEKDFTATTEEITILPNFTGMTASIDKEEIAFDETAQISGKIEGSYDGTVDYTYETDSDVIEVSETGEVSVKEGYVADEDTDPIEITVNAKAGEVTKTDKVEVVVKANFTGIESTIDSEEIEFDETANITTTVNGGINEADVKLSYEADSDIVTVEDGVVSVVDGYVAKEDAPVVITVTGKAGEVSKPATVNVTVKANFTEVTATASNGTVSIESPVTITPSTDYEGDEEVKYTYTPNEADVVEIDEETGEVTVNPNYLATEEKVVMISVKATINGVENTTEMPIALIVKPTFAGISAEAEKTILYPGQGTEIVVTVDGGYKGDEVEYSYTVDGDNWYLVDWGNGWVYAMDGQYWSGINPDDDEVVVKISATVNDKEYTDEVAIKISSNLYDILAGDAQTYTLGSEGGLSVEIDAPYDEFDEVVRVFSEELWNALEEGSDIFDGMTEEEYEAYMDANYFALEEGVDYTIEKGSTIINFTDDFLSTLTAGNYVFVAYWNNAENYMTAQGTFTVADPVVATPDTGANTKVAGNATTSALATASLLGAGAVLAMLAKRYAKNARK